MKPENFYEQATGAAGKNLKGLHALSATLLDGSKKTIIGQLKPYKNSIVVFMPVPAEDDMQIFHAVSRLRDPDMKRLRTLRSQMTRITLAQGSDMHTRYVDVSKKKEDPASFRYGVTGRVQRGKGEDEVAADEVDIAARRSNALEHSTILGAGAIQKINEIVMAYRAHESELFPVFAEWDGTANRFWVLDGDLKPTKSYIDDKTGSWHDS